MGRPLLDTYVRKSRRHLDLFSLDTVLPSSRPFATTDRETIYRKGVPQWMPQRQNRPGSHVVRPTEMEWQKTRFPGCEIKTLLFDQNRPDHALTRFAPVRIARPRARKDRQTYVLEGRLVDREGPECGLEVGPGEFVWREAGSRHVAVRTRGRADVGDVPDSNKISRARWANCRLQWRDGKRLGQAVL